MSHKKRIIALIRDLRIKGYYITNKRISSLDIQAICLNTFGIKVSISTINHGDYKEITFNYIPTSESLI